MGGIKSDHLNSLARQLWEGCMARNIFVSAQHIPGHMNLAADKLSRTFSYNLEWSLNTNVFKQITQLTLVPEIDCLPPPFSLLPQVLKKISVDKALVLLIAPVWTTQS